MRLGYLAPLTEVNIIAARKMGYDALEANVGWMTGPGMQDLEGKLPALKDVLAREKIAVSAVAIYGDAVTAAVEDAIAYYGRAMNVARELGCSIVAGMTGRDNCFSVGDNIPLFQERFDRIARMAADRGVRLAFEPWPGSVTGYGPFRWANLAISPELYDRLFEAVPHASLGIEYDASHYVWQGIDHLQVLRDYGVRIYHMHAKDILIDHARLRRTGIHGADWWRFAIPGLGQIDWPRLLSTAHEMGYEGDLALEHEDQAYSGERWTEGLTVGLKALRPLIEEHWPS
ncbi:MAG: sugar phosphate isomerase/epimerase family protein [Anaerolineae bacterium]